MEVLEHSYTRVQNWRLLTSPPLSGDTNMEADRQILAEVEAGAAPILRFFRFAEPTVTYGRLQALSSIQALIPTGWSAVQRPTGGGVVFHKSDLCLSLSWPKGFPGIPPRPSDQYRWIHERIVRALSGIVPLRMAACCDVSPSIRPFQERQCFEEPVGYDLLEGSRKRVGGALLHHRGAVLYQGSIQLPETVLGISSFCQRFISTL